MRQNFFLFAIEFDHINPIQSSRGTSLSGSFTSAKLHQSVNKSNSSYFSRSFEDI